MISISVFSQQPFLITYNQKLSGKPLDGRLLLLLSKNNVAEPRFQIEDGPNSQLVFGKDVDGWKGSEGISFKGAEFGYPVQSLKNVPAGDYYVQAVLHKYETFKRADGHTVKMPMDRGEGQHWNLAPGNLVSKPVKVRFDPKSTKMISIVLEDSIPAIKEPEETKYIKHIKIQSKLLTEFWGRPMYIGAHVLLPEGWETHTQVKYPLAIYHGHFPDDFGGFRTTPPDRI